MHLTFKKLFGIPTLRENNQSPFCFFTCASAA